MNARRALIALMAVAFVVSVVHYTDNAVNYADYPLSEPGGLPDPPDWSIAPAWFIFTAMGAVGLWLFLRGSVAPAAVMIAVYSGSGLIGIGHYLVPGATDMVWWRQAHVIADIACGVALFAFALWSAGRGRNAFHQGDSERGRSGRQPEHHGGLTEAAPAVRRAHADHDQQHEREPGPGQRPESHAGRRPV